jgi:hypothetical protein
VRRIKLYCQKAHPFGEKKSTLNVVSLDGEFLQISLKESGPIRDQFLPLIFDFLRPRRKLRQVSGEDVLPRRLPFLIV